MAGPRVVTGADPSGGAQDGGDDDGGDDDGGDDDGNPRLQPRYPVRSRRLGLRPLLPTDTAALVRYRSRDDVCRWVPFTPMSEADVAARLAGPWARTHLDGEGQGLTLGVELTSTRTLIGDVMLFLHSAEHRSGEVGYVIDPQYGGQGYATEAVSTVLHLAFDRLRLHRLVARIDARNLASARLAARLGMRQEAHLVRNEWFKGEWSDELDFAMLAEEWSARHPARDFEP
jgi:RimJ/RimL family protein N-acetyltransferase